MAARFAWGLAHRQNQQGLTHNPIRPEGPTCSLRAALLTCVPSPPPRPMRVCCRLEASFPAAAVRQAERRQRAAKARPHTYFNE